MLKKVRLTNFKSFVNEEVEVAPLTILVGANASGKSNFLDAIRFLKGLAFDLPLSEVLNGETEANPDAWPGIRGRSEEAVRLGTDSFTLDSTWATSPHMGDSVMIRHDTECRVHPNVSVEYENVGSKSFGNDSAQKRPASLIGTAGAHKSAKHCVASRLRDILRSVQFLAITPAEMRGFGRRNAPLGNQGKNISGVLATICDDEADKYSLITWLNELSASEIEDLEFREFPDLGDVMAMFVEKGGKRISARSISDGTLHFLGTLLALRTAEPGSVILIEEIESGLHPTRIRLLVEYLETVTREREIQVIATTHSPVVLQWLSDQVLRDTIVFGRIPDREGTIMRRLGDLPHFDEVVQRKGIDELFTTGWLEMAL